MITISANVPKDLESQLVELLKDFWEEAKKLPGKHPRIKDCTLAEEIRNDIGYAFDVSYIDEDILSNWADLFDPVFDSADRKFLWRDLSKANITKVVLDVKYPSVAAVYERDQREAPNVP